MIKRSSYGAVEFDLCQDHGIWLDKGELQRLVDGFAEDHRAQIDESSEARRSGRIEGAFLGLWSLFLPR
jgi:Zn-finger nucleic acid-binding protein